MTDKLKPCPSCGVPPKIGYACGEYFVYSEQEDCPYCGLDFTEMHSSEEREIEAWNRRAEPSKKQTLMQAYNEGSDT